MLKLLNQAMARTLTQSVNAKVNLVEIDLS